jgi:signal transduction histidine kinase
MNPEPTAELTADHDAEPEGPSTDLVPSSPTTVSSRAPADASQGRQVRARRTDSSFPVTPAGSGSSRLSGPAKALRSVGRLFGRIPLPAGVRAAGRRLRSPGRAIRIVPPLIAVLAGLSIYVAGRSAANQGAQRASESIWNVFDRQREERFGSIMRSLAGGARPDDGYAWIVNPKGDVVDHFGQSDFTPPLADLVTRIGEGERYEQWLSYFGDRRATLQRVDGERIAVIVQDTGWLEPERNKAKSRLFRRVWWSTLLGTAIAGLLSWLAIRPLRSTLADRREFLADAAHEMRTPLAVIRASAGHALARPRTTEEYVRSLSEIRSAAERASSGVTELLDLARFESGQAVPRLAPLRLDLLAEEVVTASRYDGVQLHHEIGPSVLVDADLSLLRQAIDNLVRNAAARGTDVTVRTHIDGRDGIVDVLDNGPGFAPEQLPYVFERFRRADRAGSTGLGLAIVASITAAHGGTAEAANRDEGGARVSLRIPRSRA